MANPPAKKGSKKGKDAAPLPPPPMSVLEKAAADAKLRVASSPLARKREPVKPPTAEEELAGLTDLTMTGAKGAAREVKFSNASLPPMEYNSTPSPGIPIPIGRSSTDGGAILHGHRQQHQGSSTPNSEGSAMMAMAMGGGGGGLSPAVRAATVGPAEGAASGKGTVAFLAAVYLSSHR